MSSDWQRDQQLQEAKEIVVVEFKKSDFFVGNFDAFLTSVIEMGRTKAIDAVLRWIPFSTRRIQGSAICTTRLVPKNMISSCNSLLMVLTLKKPTICLSL